MMKRTKVAAAVSAACTTLMAGHAVAQESEALEEVVVTGYARSLTAALDIKRESSGVMDAISAEDIGKFPDTNLAESLQRITGVSVNRVEGEGSEVTIRGFGGQFNLVTLNGRQMPAADNNIGFFGINFSDIGCVGKVDIRMSVGGIQFFDGAVRKDWSKRWVDSGNQSLGFAK